MTYITGSPTWHCQIFSQRFPGDKGETISFIIDSTEKNYCAGVPAGIYGGGGFATTPIYSGGHLRHRLFAIESLLIAKLPHNDCTWDFSPPDA